MVLLSDPGYITEEKIREAGFKEIAKEFKKEPK
jgi:hypothetical protein